MSRKRVTVPEDKKQKYIADILAKRRTQSEVAFLCDATPGTVSQWVKAANEQIARDAAAAADYILGGSSELPTDAVDALHRCQAKPVDVTDEMPDKPVEQELPPAEKSAPEQELNPKITSAHDTLGDELDDAYNNLRAHLYAAIGCAGEVQRLAGQVLEALREIV